MDTAGTTVYVVEDNANVRESIATLLRAEGLHSRLFPDASAFLAAPQTDQPGCVIIDVRLPGPSGLDLQSRVTERGRPLPVIIISGHADVPMAVRALKMGAVDFIEKPFSPGKLIDAVERALELAERWHRQRRDEEDVRSRLECLTTGERQVLRQVARGTYNKVIAAELGLSLSTVEAYRRRIMHKLGAESLYDLVRFDAFDSDAE